MFGYINAHKDLLRVCDYQVFRGYYCGLCKQLGKQFHQLTRFGLSYDMTFLAILISSLEEKQVSFTHEPCIAHPFSRRPVIHEDAGIAYSADMSIVLTYMKLKDDWNDEKSIKSFLRLFYYFPMKKTAKKYPKQLCAINENLSRLQMLEEKNEPRPDAAADCFGKLLETIFDIHADTPALAYLGYHIGRFIYLADAYNDLEEDIKKNNYNPFRARYGDNVTKEAIKPEVTDSLFFTLSEIANAYELLPIKKNKELLDNIIFLGLRKTLESF